MEPIEQLKQLLAEIDRREKELAGLKSKLGDINKALGSVFGNGNDRVGPYANLTTQPAILLALRMNQAAFTTREIRGALESGGFKPQGKAENLGVNIAIACKRLLKKNAISLSVVRGKKRFRIVETGPKFTE